MQYDCSNFISYICRNEYEYFFNKPNVVGVGRGYKVENGVCTFKECIKIFLNKKLPINQLCLNEVIPSVYKGVLTDVEESGPIKFQSLTDKIRPTICGYSIGPNIVKQDNSETERLKNTTTLGCIVTDDIHEYVLTTNHGIITKHFQENTHLLQPSIEDGGKYPNDSIGTIFKFIPLKPKTLISKPENLVDASITYIDNLKLITPIIYQVGIPLGVEDARLNDTVMKVGRTSGLTYGKVKALDTTLEVSDQENVYIFKDQIMTSVMSDNGDSGALLLNERKYAIGLNVAAGKSTSGFNKIKNILELLDVRIVTN